MLLGTSARLGLAASVQAGAAVQLHHRRARTYSGDGLAVAPMCRVGPR